MTSQANVAFSRRRIDDKFTVAVKDDELVRIHPAKNFVWQTGDAKRASFKRTP